MNTSTAVRPTVATWFEIPAENFERAIAFYEGIFATTLRRERINGEDLAVFPYDRPGISGAVMHRPGESGAQGSLLYLNADGRLDEILARVIPAGGGVAAAKRDLEAGMGTFAVITDSEGNRLGLHAIL